MSVDPSDDCTFWYTNMYYQTTGSNWQTRIGSFTFPSCPRPTAVSLSAFGARGSELDGLSSELALLAAGFGLAACCLGIRCARR